MSKPKWKIQEHVVATLEQHLNQRAQVLTDVRLPVLSDSSRRPRQCDVVIVEGKEPRMTRTIVEVQKRGDKPSIADFDGWYAKMVEVGAQHLLCVSEIGFPSSIEKKAERLGPTVRLLTLKQIETEGQLLPSLIASPSLQVVTYERLTGLQLEYEHLVRQDPSQTLPSPHARIFRTGDNLISVTDLMDQHLFGKPANLEELPSDGSLFTLAVHFNELQDLGHLTLDGEWVRLKSLKIGISLSTKMVDIVWHDAKYEQIGFGDIGWALAGRAVIDGAEAEIVAPLKPEGPGQYVLGRPLTLTDHDMFVAIDGRGYQSRRVR